MKRDREIVRLRRGAYRAAGSVESWEQAMIAAVLTAPDEAVASGLAAGRIWGLPHCQRAQVEITVPLSASHQATGVIVHRSKISDRERSRHNYIPVTNLPRTVISLSNELTISQLADVIDFCIDKHRLQPEKILDLLDEIGSRGRGKTSVLKPLLIERLGTERTESWLERRTLKWFEKHGITGFVPQHPVRVPLKKIPYRLDFAWPGVLFAVEPEGYKVHVGCRSAFDKGHVKKNAVSALGWRIHGVTVNTDETVFISEVVAILQSLGVNDTYVTPKHPKLPGSERVTA